jgi:WhiB family redox-sensing transcriptional regulator
VALAERDVYRGLMVGLDVPDVLEVLPPRPAWMADALCREPQPGVSFFPARGEPLEPARAVCARCLVRQECLAYALADADLVGVWGGTSERERRRMRQAAATAGAVA